MVLNICFSKSNFERGVKRDKMPSKYSNNSAVNSRANTLRSIGNNDRSKLIFLSVVIKWMPASKLTFKLEDM